MKFIDLQHVTIPMNEGVLHFLQHQSAHTDVADALLRCVNPLGDVQAYCPSPANCRFLVVSSQRVVFAAARGMNQISFRLDPILRTRALVSGATPEEECGEGWVTFVLFRDDWPKQDLEFWARKAYVYARELATQ